MKRLFTRLLIVGITLLVTGCSSLGTIKSNMDMKSVSMPYEMDSVPPVTNKRPVAVSVEPVRFDPSLLGTKSQTRKEKVLLLPLVIINVWERYDICMPGSKAFSDDIPTFMRTNLVREINHLGLVRTDTGQASEYTLDVSIDELKAEGPYRRSFVSYLFLFSRSEIAGPAVANLKVTYALKKGNQVVRKNTFSASKSTQWSKRKYTDNAHMQMDYTEAMVNATASNFKHINKQIVEDLNDYFSRVN